jgi:hypothetical protein
MAASIVAALGSETIAVRRGGVPDWLAMEVEQASHVAEHDHP